MYECKECVMMYNFKLEKCIACGAPMKNEKTEPKQDPMIDKLTEVREYNRR